MTPPKEGRDPWGREPGVREMRRIFAALEQRQRELLRRRGIPEFEPRLARARRQALLLLERGWASAMHEGLTWTAEDLGTLYENILAAVLAREGLLDPPQEPPGPWGPLLSGLFNEEV